MAISLRGSASNNGANANSNLTVTLPGGVAQDDVVYAAYGCLDTSGTDRNVATVTAGYTELADLFANDTNDTNLGVFRKVQGASPDSTVVFSGVGLSTWGIWGAVEVLIGVNTTTPEDATTTTATGTNTAVSDPPSITTVTNNAWVIAIGGAGETAPNGGFTAPTNYVNLEDDFSAAGWGAIMMATRAIAVAGAENPGVFGGITVNTNDSWCAASVAVRPDAATPAVFTGTATITFSQTGALQGGAAGSGTAVIAFSQTGAFGARTAFASTATIVFGQTGALTGTSALAGTSAVTFSQTGALAGSFVAAGTAAITFSQSGDFVAGTVGDATFTGTIGLVFDQTGALNADAAAAGTATLVFAQTGAFAATATFGGTSPVTFGQTGALNVGSAWAGTSAIIFGQTGAFASQGAYAGTIPIVFSQTGDFDAGSPIVDNGIGRGRVTSSAASGRASLSSASGRASASRPSGRVTIT